MVMFKVTKNQGFKFSLENNILEKLRRVNLLKKKLDLY